LVGICERNLRALRVFAGKTLWDQAKTVGNLNKHGVSFEEASTAFGDHVSRTVRDPLHLGDENRFVFMGQTNKGRIVVVVCTIRVSVAEEQSCRGCSLAHKEAKIEAIPLHLT
jgi:uncharacterized DUF497 family protein